MSSVVFLNRFYWPEEVATAQLLADVTAALVERGHRVTVVTSRPARSQTESPEIRNGVRIARVPVTRWGQRSLFGRLFDFATFHVFALWRVFRLLRRGDAVVAMTDPPMLGVLVWPVARLRGARLFHWVQDIYPEIAADVTGRRWPLLLRPLRNYTWRHSAGCIVPGADMGRLVAEAGVPAERIVISPNWAPSGLEPPSATEVAEQRAAWGLTGRFVAIYSGNLGRVHDLEPLLEVAAALRDDPAFTLLFVGNGAQKGRLEASVRTRGILNVHFRPPQPRDRLASALGAGDVHFVTLLPGAERCVFPSKLYGIAKVGRPVIFVGEPDCEVARLVKSHRFGSAFQRTETAEIADALRDLQANPERGVAMGAAARRFADDGLTDAINVWHRQIGPELAGRSRGA